MTPLRDEHYALLAVLYEEPGGVAMNKLPRGWTPNQLCRRDLAEWIRPDLRPAGAAIGLRITQAGRIELKRHRLRQKK
jgi:hypothetical protein